MTGQIGKVLSIQGFGDGPLDADSVLPAFSFRDSQLITAGKTSKERVKKLLKATGIVSLQWQKPRIDSRDVWNLFEFGGPGEEE
jgi:hypothetical protein